MPRGVEDVAEFFDFAASQALQAAQQTAANADGIGHVAEDEFPGRIAGVHETVKLLSVAASGKEKLFRCLAFGVDAGSDGKELNIAMEGAEFAGYAGDARSAAMLGFFDHASV